MNHTKTYDLKLPCPLRNDNARSVENTGPYEEIMAVTVKTESIPLHNLGDICMSMSKNSYNSHREIMQEKWEITIIQYASFSSRR